MSRENSALEVEDEEFVDELKPDTKLMLGQYTIEDFLAAGGFGITYLAKDSLGRRVVIKECFPGSFCRRQNTSVTPRSRAHQNELKSIVRLFSQEAMALAKANHPNIVGVHQVFEENNTAYMALDYVQGRDLLEILQEDPDSLRPDLVEGYLVKILDAIKHIHQLGMLHRDISPDNIIINEQGEPILIDFGAARESTNERVTRMLSALRVVKDGYSPQEFYIAGSDQGPSCDLYSLAASFYHLITGDLPPDSQWRLSACAAGDDDPYVPLGNKTDAYSKAFTSALDKGMAILPRDRMQSAEEWISYLEGGKVAPAVTSKISRSEPATVTAKPSKPMLPILLGSTALAAAVGAGFFMMSGSDDSAPSGTLDQTDVAVATPAPETAPATVTEQPSTPTLAEAEPETPAVVPAPEVVAEATPAPVETPEPVEPVGLSDAEPEVAITIAEPPVPAVEETTDFVVAPIIAALPKTGVVPQPRPLRDIDAKSAAAQPVIETTAPAAPEPQVAEAEPPKPIQPVETNNASLDFFMSMAESSQPEITTARAPRAVAPAAQRQPSAPEPTPAPVEAEPPQDNLTGSGIVTRYVPVLPFTLSPWTPGMVLSAAEGAPSWLTKNSRIVSIEGQPVASNDDIQAMILSLAPQDGSESFSVAISVDTGLNTAVEERMLPINSEQHTLLLNGLQFVSRQHSGGWTTEVTEAPDASNFKVGDKLVSFVSTWEDIDGPNTFQSILERELANGTSSFSFAVSRDGEIWIEAFNLAALGN